MGRIVLIGANLKDWKKKKKKGNRKKLKADLDKQFSLIIRSRGKCERCEKKSPLNTAHIFSRNNLATRWDKDNVLCLCVGCHFWSHQNPIEFVEWLSKLRGVKWYNDLREKANKVKKWEIIELEKLLEEFKEEVKISEH